MRVTAPERTPVPEPLDRTGPESAVGSTFFLAAAALPVAGAAGAPVDPIAVT